MTGRSIFWQFYLAFVLCLFTARELQKISFQILFLLHHRSKNIFKNSRSRKNLIKFYLMFHLKAQRHSYHRPSCPKVSFETCYLASFRTILIVFLLIENVFRIRRVLAPRRINHSGLFSNKIIKSLRMIKL